MVFGIVLILALILYERQPRRMMLPSGCTSSRPSPSGAG